jgi:hypothetical protein
MLTADSFLHTNNRWMHPPHLIESTYLSNILIFLVLSINF